MINSAMRSWYILQQSDPWGDELREAFLPFIKCLFFYTSAMFLFSLFGGFYHEVSSVSYYHTWACSNSKMITILKVKMYDNKNKNLWKRKTHRGSNIFKERTISFLTTTKWFREVVQETPTKTFIFLGLTFPIKPC